MFLSLLSLVLYASCAHGASNNNMVVISDKLKKDLSACVTQHSSSDKSDIKHKLLMQVYKEGLIFKHNYVYFSVLSGNKDALKYVHDKVNEDCRGLNVGRLKASFVEAHKNDNDKVARMQKTSTLKQTNPIVKDGHARILCGDLYLQEDGSWQQFVRYSPFNCWDDLNEKVFWKGTNNAKKILNKMSGGSVQEKVKPVIQELKKNNKSGALFSVNLSKLVPIVRAVKLQYAEYLEENRISSELNSRSLVRSRGIAIVIDPQNQL